VAPSEIGDWSRTLTRRAMEISLLTRATLTLDPRWRFDHPLNVAGTRADEGQ
jgi:hypothetical protein